MNNPSNGKIGTVTASTVVSGNLSIHSLRPESCTTPGIRKWQDPPRLQFWYEHWYVPTYNVILNNTERV